MAFDRLKILNTLAALVVGAAMMIGAPAQRAVAQERHSSQSVAAQSEAQKLALHNRTYEDPSSVPGKTRAAPTPA